MLRLVETRDGSHTLLHEEYGVTFHSRYGAIQESRHVFLEAGLHPRALEKKELFVLEVGFGTGLNAFLTWLDAESHGWRIHYVAVEAHPLTLDLAHQLNYAQQLDRPEWQDRFLQLHRAPWNEVLALSPAFQLEKIQARLEELRFPPRFDVVFFDAFAPGAQPELWEEPIFRMLYEALLPGGVLSTYCAKGAVKRILRAVGFEVEALPGPPGKREMTRALKKK